MAIARDRYDLLAAMPLRGMPNWPRAVAAARAGLCEATDIEGNKPGRLHAPWRVTWRVTDAGRRFLAFHRRPPTGTGPGAPNAGGRVDARAAA